jgi:hypothetical protein
MELIWLVLALLAVDLAAILFAADTRPGLEHSSRSRVRRHGALRGGTVRPGTRRFIGG